MTYSEFTDQSNLTEARRANSRTNLKSDHQSCRNLRILQFTQIQFWVDLFFMSPVHAQVKLPDHDQGHRPTQPDQHKD